MFTKEEIKRKIEPMNLKKVSNGSGVPYNTIYRLATTDSNHDYETVKKLSDWLEGLEK
jgi:hypothetical protein